MLGLGAGGLLELLTFLEQKSVGTRPEQCTRLRHRLSGCSLCADSCPTGAISWDGSLQVDGRRCNGCGVCAAVCPTGALEARSPSNEELLVKLRALSRERTSVSFVCAAYLKSRGGAGGPCLQVNCLGRLDESIVVGAYSLGIREISLVDGCCPSCPADNGRRVAERTVQVANSLLHACGAGSLVVFRPDLPPPTTAPAEAPVRPEAVSRRAFFSLLTGRVKQSAATALDGVITVQPAQGSDGHQPKTGELPTSLPAKRRLLLWALRRLGDPSSLPVEGGVQGWVRFTFDERCTGCRMCAHFCPTGALRKAEDGSAFGVEFVASHCTNCGLCRDLCHWKAVNLLPLSDLAEVSKGSTELLPMPRAARPMGYPRLGG